MPSWMTDFLGIAKSWAQGSSIWRFCMSLVTMMMSGSPDALFPDAWSYVTDTLYPMMLTIGIFLLNLFCLIGFIRQASNLRENVTTEMWIELFIKVLIANVLMTNGLSIIQDFFNAAGGVELSVMSDHYPDIFSDEIDAGAIMAYLLFGIIYIVVSAICGIMIVVEVLARFLNLFLLTAAAPVALSTLAGGRGIENSAYACIKSFLTNVFQIVVIAVILQVGSMMIKTLGTTDQSIFLVNWFDGATEVMKSFLIMVFMTTAIKGSDNFLKRAFDLR